MKKRILMALLAAMTAVSIAACSSEETAGDNVQESPEGNASESAAEDTGEDTEASAQENAAEVAQENASGESFHPVKMVPGSNIVSRPKLGSRTNGTSWSAWMKQETLCRRSSGKDLPLYQEKRLELRRMPEILRQILYHLQIYRILI